MEVHAHTTSRNPRATPHISWRSRYHEPSVPPARLTIMRPTQPEKAPPRHLLAHCGRVDWLEPRA